MFGTAGGSSRRNMSNPAQNRLPQPVIVNGSEFRICGVVRQLRPLIPEKTVPEQREKAGTDGTRFSPVPAPPPQTAGIPWGRLRKAAGDTDTANPRNPIARRMCPFCSLITPRHKRSCLSVAGLSILPRFHAAHVNSSLMLSHLPAICSQVTRQWGPESSRIQSMGLLS